MGFMPSEQTPIYFKAIDDPVALVLLKNAVALTDSCKIDFNDRRLLIP